MAALNVTEYAQLAYIEGVGMGQVPKEPRVTSQSVTFTTSTQSNAFNAKTRVVRVHTDTACYIEFGADPTAITVTSTKMAANQTEYFGVEPGHKVAVVT